MAIKFNTDEVRSYDGVQTLMKGSYLNPNTSTSLIGTAIHDDDLFIMQDVSENGGSATTATVGKIKAQDIKTYLGTTQITGITLSADVETAACTDSAGEVDFMIAGGNYIQTTSTANQIQLDVAMASTSVVGAASFLSDDFAVSGAGQVSIKGNGVTYAQMPAAVDAGVVGQTESGELTYAEVATEQIADNAVSLAKMTHLSAGSIISYNSGTNPVEIAPGTAEHVLTTKGAGALPQWQALPASTWTITDGSTSNAAFATGETFQYTAADGITAEISGEATTTTVLTIGLADTVTINDEITGDTGNKALWTAAQGTITIGNASGNMSLNGVVTMNNGATSLNSADLTSSDASVAYGVKATSYDDWGGSGTAINVSLLFAGADRDESDAATKKRQTTMLMSNFNGLTGTTASACLEVKHAPGDGTFADGNDNTDETGEYAPLKAGAFVCDSTRGALIKAGASEDGAIVWDGTDLYVYDAS